MAYVVVSNPSGHSSDLVPGTCLGDASEVDLVRPNCPLQETSNETHKDDERVPHLQSDEWRKERLREMLQKSELLD